MKTERNSRILVWAVLPLLAAWLMAISGEAKYGGGSGTADDPYQIWTAEHMNAIGVDPCDLANHFRLMVDIDMAGEAGGEIRVIGDSEKPFTGSFDGNGHTISHLACNCTSKDNVGLFGYVDGIDAEIRNLGLIEPDVQASTGDNVGSLVGQLKDGVVTGCYVQGGSVSGNQMVGGLVGGFVGTTQGTIRDCLWDAETSGQVSSAGGTGKTTAEMQTAKTFLDAGWDFTDETTNGKADIWQIDEGKGYPRLRREAGEPNSPAGGSNPRSGR